MSKPKHIHTKCGEKLTFFNQLEFKAWAKKLGLNPDWYYFDNIYPVDAISQCSCPNVPGLFANGTKTWDEALTILKAYFKDRRP